ncbi:MAG: hypothetical protein GWO24_09595, partial [Akkermansiaceae bacterium]|nr:hypothetical protein [Akkermansiaceae bacterium]
TGAGLPLLTEKILPRLLGGGENLLEKELGTGQEVRIRITSENRSDAEVTPEAPQLEIGDQAPAPFEAPPLSPGVPRQLELRQTFPEPV